MHEKYYWDARNYAENSTVQTLWATDFINNRMHLQDVKHLLDLGCGDGRITAYLAKTLPNAQIVGLDPSEEMIAQANSLLYEERLPNLSFIQGTTETYPFPTPFDAVVSFSCIHWVPDQPLLMATLASHIRKGGTLYFLCAPRVEHNLNSILNATTKLPQWKEHFVNYVDSMHLRTRDQWEQLLKEVGFTPKRVELVATPIPFPSVEKFNNWVAAWAPPLRKLPEHLHGAFMKDMLDIFFREHPEKEPTSLIYDDIMLEVEAQRLI